MQLKGGLSLRVKKIKNMHQILYLIATKYLIYRLLNLILKPSNHIPKLSKILFNGSVIKEF